jgi:hypothetical protein
MRALDDHNKIDSRIQKPRTVRLVLKLA